MYVFCILFQRLSATGLPLHFTVTVANDAGASVKAVCQIPTYDITIPVGRFSLDFSTTSNAAVLLSSIVVSDDSKIDISEVSVGFGKDLYGDQVVPWTDVDLSKQNHNVDISKS